jgi:2,3-bisphosphoglycerate-dependent phosphoglycerate mutase
MTSDAHAHLLLVRHGESETNASNTFSGRADPQLTERGLVQARQVGELLATLSLVPDRVFTSEMKRCHQTTEIILKAAERSQLPIVRSAALNERDYGVLTGMDKTAAALEFGKENVHRWRRSYTDTPPGGESLRDTAARVLAFYIQTVLPAAMAGGATLVVSHGNTLRALIMALDNMDAAAIERFDVSTASLLLYKLGPSTAIIERVQLN